MTVEARPRCAMWDLGSLCPKLSTSNSWLGTQQMFKGIKDPCVIVPHPAAHCPKRTTEDIRAVGNGEDISSQREEMLHYKFGDRVGRRGLKNKNANA